MTQKSKSAHNRILVSEKALIARINRRLAKEYQKLRTPRTEMMRLQLGWFYIHDMSRNLPLNTHVNIEELGREIGALTPSETCSE